MSGENKEVIETKKKGRKKETIEVGDFVFYTSPTKHLKSSMDSVNKGDSNKDLEEKEADAIKLMNEHYEFFGELNKVSQIAKGYVKRGSIIKCSLCKGYLRLDAYIDHGVMDKDGQSVMTCKDCLINQNIHSFGVCECPESVYRNLMFHPNTEEVVAVDGSIHYKCMPLLGEEWKQKEGTLFISAGDAYEYAKALMQDAYLTCAYGGIITIEEILRMI